MVTNGAGVPGGNTASAPVNAGTFNTADNFFVTYDGTNLTIQETQGTNTHSATYALNIANTAGPIAFIGFTGGTGGNTAQQQISNFSFASTGTVNATNTLGAPLSPAGSTDQLKMTQIDGGAPSLSLSGGGGAAGSTTVSILPWGWSTTGSYMTYDATNGVRPLNTATEYVPTFAASTSPFDNVRTTAATTLNGPVEVNSLISTAGGVTGNFDMTLRSGALASTAAQTIGVNTANLKTGVGGSNNVELVVFAAAATNLNYNIGTTAGLTKFGGGTLTLGGNNTFTGGVTINGGVLAYSADSQLGAAANTVTFGLGTNSVSPGSLGLQYVNPAQTPRRPRSPATSRPIPTGRSSARSTRSPG